MALDRLNTLEEPPEIEKILRMVNTDKFFWYGGEYYRSEATAPSITKYFTQLRFKIEGFLYHAFCLERFWLHLDLVFWLHLYQFQFGG